jgi:hypothetical protein
MEDSAKLLNPDERHFGQCSGFFGFFGAIIDPGNKVFFTRNRR